MALPLVPLGVRMPARAAAIVLTVIAFALAITTGALHALAALRGLSIHGDYSIFNVLVAMGFSASGAVIAARRPANPIGWSGFSSRIETSAS